MAREIDEWQVKAARGLLDWSQEALAREARVSVPTVKRLEGDASGVNAASFAAVVGALEGAGILFISPGAIVSAGVGEGVPVRRGVALVDRA